MERAERQLCARLTDGLCRNHADGLTLLHHATGGKVAAIALHADTLARLAGEHRADLHALNLGLLDGLGQRLGNLLTGGHDDIARLGIDHIVYRHTTEDALREAGDNLIAILQGCADESAQCAAVLLVDNHVVRYIDESAGQVCGVGRLHGRVGQALTGAVGGDEVLQHRHALLEVRQDGVLNNLVPLGAGLLGLGHQTTDT